jgi:hypothetical protein
VSIRLDQASRVLQTTDAVLHPGRGSLGPPWIVAAGIAEEFSFQDFVVVPGRLAIEPPPPKKKMT